MAETTLDLRNVAKPAAYTALIEQANAVLAGMDDQVAAMSTLACMVFHGFAPLWAGFYRVVKPGALLRVGPYQGTLGCLEIAFSRGVCGLAATERRTVIVGDVHEFPGHIACDGRSRSEIVVPVFSRSGELIAVFDVDHTELHAFSEEDQVGLEQLMSWFSKAH
jgi:L-methionine (R)-S-oxide reductase